MAHLEVAEPLTLRDEEANAELEGPGTGLEGGPWPWDRQRGGRFLKK